MPSPPLPPHAFQRIGHNSSVKFLAQASVAKMNEEQNQTDNPLAPFGIEQAFQLFATFCGDVEKTAHALSVKPSIVIAIAAREKWNERLAPLFELQKGTRPGDVERGINRAVNFVQAHRLRLCVDRLIDRLYKLTDDELLEYCFETTVKKDREGNETTVKRIVTRPLADLATAMEKCQAQTYHALNDTAPERAKRQEAPNDYHSAADLHSELSKAMAEVRQKNSPQAVLFDAQLQKAELLLKGQPPPAAPPVP
jgi:hypothetical protein